MRDATSEEATLLAGVAGQGHATLSKQLQLPHLERADGRQFVFSLEAYNKHYGHTVYLLLDTPSCISDGWKGARCTCRANGVAGDCEHSYRLRTLAIPGRIEPAMSLEACATAKAGGRPRGSFTTARGKRAAEAETNVA